jgi:hypothetical protein
MKKNFILILTLAALLSWSHLRAEEPASVETFVGDWTGVGLKEDRGDPLWPENLEVRDLDINIKKTETGLIISWVTHMRETAEEKGTTTILNQTAPNVFVGNKSGDVLKGETAVWGRIEEQSLIVYILEVDQDGIYNLARYERMLLANDSMYLFFTRTRDGKTVRRVEAELVRTTTAE